ncbi:VanZ family protein [Glaciibacter superstes]|uniref:VanZ family protein n=1 Tax=Glaciibacter superstes TaxID=501023 RepID=UPI0003B4F52D|nr:VanZ family protein [Glaciibacter superstes]
MLHRHPILSVVTLVYLAFVGWVTLNPQPSQTSSNGWLLRALGFFARHDSTDWITYSLVEFIANIAMFIPIGVFFLLLFGRRKWWLAIFVGVVLTCFIEFVQLFLPARYPDVSDLVANSTGTVIGVSLALVLTSFTIARRTSRRRDSSDRAPMPRGGTAPE